MKKLFGPDLPGPCPANPEPFWYIVAEASDPLWRTDLDCFAAPGSLGALERQSEHLDAATGAFERAIGSRGGGDGQFGCPRGLAALPGGRLVVPDSRNHRVVVLGQSRTA